MLDSPLLVDQYMICGLKTELKEHFPWIRLDVFLFSGIYQILTFSFDPPTQSYTCKYIIATIGPCFGGIIDRASLSSTAFICLLNLFSFFVFLL